MTPGLEVSVNSKKVILIVSHSTMHQIEFASYTLCETTKKKIYQCKLVSVVLIFVHKFLADGGQASQYGLSTAAGVLKRYCSLLHSWSTLAVYTETS